MDAKMISMFIMGCLYIMAGINHFINPKFYLKITPNCVPKKEMTNYIVGLVEMILGVMLFNENTQSFGAWGIIILLIAVFPANIFHYQKAKAKGIDVVATLIRLPIQALLIAWAYIYT